MDEIEVKKRDYTAQTEWNRKHTTYIGLKLQNSTDADIIGYLENVQSKQGEIKRLLRLAMAIEAGQQEK